MIWEEFRQSDPELAGLGQERFDHTGLVLIATLRKVRWAANLRPGRHRRSQ